MSKLKIELGFFVLLLILAPFFLSEVYSAAPEPTPSVVEEISILPTADNISAEDAQSIIRNRAIIMTKVRDILNKIDLNSDEKDFRTASKQLNKLYASIKDKNTNEAAFLKVIINGLPSNLAPYQITEEYQLASLGPEPENDKELKDRHAKLNKLYKDTTDKNSPLALYLKAVLDLFPSAPPEELEENDLKNLDKKLADRYSAILQTHPDYYYIYNQLILTISLEGLESYEKAKLLVKKAEINLKKEELFTVYASMVHYIMTQLPNNQQDVKAVKPYWKKLYKALSNNAPPANDRYLLHLWIKANATLISPTEAQPTLW